MASIVSIKIPFDANMQNFDAAFAFTVANYNCDDSVTACKTVDELLNTEVVPNESISAKDCGDGNVEISYDEEIYDEDLIQRICKTCKIVMGQLTSKENVADIDLIDEDDETELDSFNHPNIPTATNDNVVSIFRKIARKFANNIAVSINNESLTYAQVDEITDRIATEIHQKVNAPAGSEPVVSILINRNLMMLLAPLAALKAGCAYQPLDPSYPKERLNFMMKDADAKLLICDEELRDLVDEYTGECLTTEQCRNIKAERIAPEIGELDPDRLFILLYTSGSTGVPKGVQLLHSNILALEKTHTKKFNIHSDDVVSLYASFGFDACMLDTYAAITNGAQLLIVPEDIRLDLVALNKYFEDHKVTITFMTTQVGYQFAINFPSCGVLRHFLVGGEKLATLTPPVSYQFHNGYGPTECTIYATEYIVDKVEQNIPIGKSNETSPCYIANKFGKRLPLGATGELIIYGPQVARGYLNRPEKTLEAFFEHKGYRAYHSGDIVRYNEDGNIVFVGRKDGQVKIRGFRIELKEVEAIIREYNGIKDATVQAFDDPNGGKFIAAYVVSDEQIDINALNEFILNEKPPYMVPAVTMQIDSIPLNVNQKVDKKKLPTPEIKFEEVDDNAPVAPLNILEQEIKDIVVGIVNTENFGLTTVLGFVGLTSISGIRLATEVYKKYGVQLNAKTLAKTATIQTIENEIINHLLGKSADAVETDAPAEDEKITSSPLSFAQQGVFLDCLRNPEATAYNMPMQISFPEEISKEQICEAVRATVLNHNSMSAYFEIVNGEGRMRFTELTANDIEIPELSVDDVDAHKADFIRPFNLNRAPLFRFEIVNEHNLFADIHHLIGDGASIDLFITELTAHLGGKNVETENYSFAQYIKDEKAAEGGEDYNEAKAFFMERLQTCEGGSSITADLKSADNTPARQKEVEKVVDGIAIEKFARKLGVNPSSVYLAAAYYVVGRYTNAKQVYLATISSGRSDLRTYNTTGMFVNTLALTSQIGEQTVGEYIRQTADDFAATLAHENYPFAQIAADTEFRPETVFEYQVGVISNYTVGDKKVDMKVFDQDTSKFKMKIEVNTNAEGNIIVRLGFNSSLYTEGLCQRILDSIVATIEHFCNDSEAKLKCVSIMSEAQAKEVEAMHTTATMDVPVKLFYKPIEHYAEKTPDNLALIACDRKLTYAEFNSEVNKIARALQARGVKHADRVVLLLPRTSSVMLCVFAVSKCGAAYIPCDPAYPAERISLITEDSEATLIITTADKVGDYEDGKAVDIEVLKAEAATMDDSNINAEVSPEDLAYLIYTSGSTGRPKGVMLRHIGICSYLYDHPANIHIHNLTKNGVTGFLCITTLSFDMSLKEWAAALHNGITAVLANEDEVNNPMLLADLFRNTNANAINGTPSRILGYMELPDFCEQLKKCKCVLSGGEKYSPTLLTRLHELNVPCVMNTYGPTEVTVSSNIGDLTKAETITVGAPILNYHEWVVDADGNELPVGVVGELYIGGPGVARGYNNLPEQTAARFIDFAPNGSKEKPMRIYKSGDYARWLPTGEVEILGRTDNQIKLRGLRIELGEVESAISHYEGVKQAVVCIRTLQGKEHLSAFFTADRKIDIEDMKNEIGKSLTHYMVPTAYLQLDKMPLTPNGKADLKHMPDPEIAQGVETEYVAPVGKEETDFCDIISRILNVEKVGAMDSFFDLGGTSLLVTRLLVEADKMGYTIGYAQVFDNKTPRALARLVNPNAVEEEEVDHEIVDYDYNEITDYLKKNTIETMVNGERMPLNDVLLTGSTGFLGIHILYELIQNYDNKVYCLVRPSGGLSAEKRLQNLMFYYFENDFSELFGKRLFVVEGDVTSKISIPNCQKGMTVINCAALVKHFAQGTEIEDINVGGVKNCLDFCRANDARLVQVSTFSTSGQSVNGYPDPKLNFTEQMLFFGQDLGNKYVHSKFLGERLALEAAVKEGISVKIMRVGTLSPRSTDGEFQINFGTNAAMGRLHMLQMLGKCSYSMMAGQLEYSPINEVSRAILLLSTTPKDNTVFHPFNDHRVPMADVVSEFSKIVGSKMEYVEDEVFQQTINEAKADPEKARVMQSMLAYQSKGNAVIEEFPKYNPFTTQILYRLGFQWSPTSKDYVDRFLNSIATLNFFD